MKDQTVPTSTDTGEPQTNGYAVTFAELRRIADALDMLPPGDKPLSGQLYLFFGDGSADLVDALSFAINGTQGETKLGAEGWAHMAWITMDSLTVHVRAKVPGPPDERDAELERLRAEVAALRSAPASTKPDGLERDPDIDLPLVATVGDDYGHDRIRNVTEAAPVPDGITSQVFPLRGDAARPVSGAPARRDVRAWLDARRPDRASIVEAAHAQALDAGPATQTKPQCTPECRTQWPTDDAAPIRHLDGCPRATAT